MKHEAKVIHSSETLSWKLRSWLPEDKSYRYFVTIELASGEEIKLNERAHVEVGLDYIHISYHEASELSEEMEQVSGGIWESETIPFSAIKKIHTLG